MQPTTLWTRSRICNLFPFEVRIIDDMRRDEVYGTRATSIQPLMQPYFRVVAGVED